MAKNIKTVDILNVNQGIQDLYAQTPIAFADTSNGSLQTSAQSIVGAINEVLNIVGGTNNVYSGTVTTDLTWTDLVPAKYSLENLTIENTAAGTVAIAVGITSSGTEIIPRLVVGSADLISLGIQETFSSSASQTIYISSADWTNSPSLNITARLEKSML